MSSAQKTLAYVWLLASLAIVALSFSETDIGLRRNYSNGTQLVAAYLSAFFCFRTCLIFPSGSPLRQVWGLISGGVLAWAMGQTYFWLYSVLNQGQETPYPSLADIGFLLIGPLVVVALLRFRHASGLSAPTWGGVSSLLLLVVSCIVATNYNWEGIESSDLMLRFVSIAYALSDPMLLAVTVWVASGFGRGTIARSWWYVVVGVISFFVANQIYSFMVFNETYESGAMSDVFWPLGFGLIALGAVLSRVAHSRIW